MARILKPTTKARNDPSLLGRPASHLARWQALADQTFELDALRNIADAIREANAQKPATEEPTTPALPKPSRAPKKSARRNRSKSRVGRPPKDDWHTVAQKYLNSFARKNKRIATAPEVLKHALGFMKKPPGLRAVQIVIKD
jgi:hypothetical protein